MKIKVVERELGFNIPTELKNIWAVETLMAKGYVFCLFNWSSFYLFSPHEIIEIESELRLQPFEGIRNRAFSSLRKGAISQQIYERVRTNLKQDILVMSAKISKQLQEPVLAFGNCMWGDRQHYLIYRVEKKAYFLWAYRREYLKPIFLGQNLDDFIPTKKERAEGQNFYFNAKSFLDAFSDNILFFSKVAFIPELPKDKLSSIEAFYKEQAEIDFIYMENDYFKPLVNYLEFHNLNYNKRAEKKRLYIINSPDFEAIALALLDDKKAAQLVQKGLISPKFNKYIPEQAYRRI